MNSSAQACQDPAVGTTVQGQYILDICNQKGSVGKKNESPYLSSILDKKVFNSRREKR